LAYTLVTHGTLDKVKLQVEHVHMFYVVWYAYDPIPRIQCLTLIIQYATSMGELFTCTWGCDWDEDVICFDVYVMNFSKEWVKEHFPSSKT